MTPETILQEINKLNIADKINLLDSLWDSINQVTDNNDIPLWQRDELDKRLAEHRQHQDGDLPSHEFLQQIRNNL